MILRTYGCEECGHLMEVALASDQWNAEPPECPRCSTRTYQEFKPIAITGSPIARATEIARTIASEDYRVADIQSPSRSGKTVRYKDENPGGGTSTWGAGAMQGALQQAIAIGRQTRLQHGNGLDVLHGALKSGAQRDLIADSKARSIKVWLHAQNPRRAAARNRVGEGACRRVHGDC